MSGKEVFEISATGSDAFARRSTRRDSAGFVHTLSSTTYQCEEGGTATPLQVTVNAITAIIGLKFLYLPSQVVGASLLMSVIITALAMALCAWSLMISVEAADKYQTFDIGGLCRHLPGKVGPALEIFVNGVIWLATFLGVIYLMILLSDVVDNVLHWNRSVVIMAGTALAIPTTFLPPQYLSFTSTLAFAMNGYIFLLVILYSFGVLKRGAENSTAREERVCWFGVSHQAIVYVVLFCGVISAGTIHPAALQMYYSLADRSVDKFRQIIYRAFAIAYVLFVSFQCIGRVGFGFNVSQNIMEDFANDYIGDAARLGLIFLVLGNYPFGIGAMIAPLQGACGSKVAHCMKIVICVCVMFVSFYLTDLGKVGVFGGAIGLIGLNALPPGLVGIYLVSKRPISMLLLIVMGSVLFVIALMKPSVEQAEKEAIFADCILG